MFKLSLVQKEYELQEEKRFMKLTQKESAVIRLRYGIDDDIQRTYQEISKIVNLSSTMVKQLEHRAMRKLRHPSNKETMMEIKETIDLINTPKD